MSKNVKLKDVAKLANVGMGTASRVLNNHPHVKAETKEKVLKAMETLNYSPNSAARSLKSKKSKVLGVILVHLSSFFYGEILEGIEDGADEHGYGLILNQTRATEKRIFNSIKIMEEKKVDGIIFMGGILSEAIQNRLVKTNVPILLVSTGHDFKNIDTKEVFSSINIDNETAAFVAVDYLCSLNHKKISMLSIKKHDTNSALRRIRGYKKALERNDVEYKDENVFECLHSFKDAYQTTRKILEQTEVPTAIFCYSDLLAMGASRAVFEKGLKVPDDISIVGFDGIESTEYFYPSITTMRQPRYIMGVRAVELVKDEINSKVNYKQHLILPVTLEKRESCKKV